MIVATVFTLIISSYGAGFSASHGHSQAECIQMRDAALTPMTAGDKRWRSAHPPVKASAWKDPVLRQEGTRHIDGLRGISFHASDGKIYFAPPWPGVIDPEAASRAQLAICLPEEPGSVFQFHISGASLEF